MVEIAPAIRTRYDERYDDVERIKQIGSDTTFHRGFGETGSRVELVLVPDGCPRCGENKMVLSRGLKPDDYDSAVFYCTNFACPHFVSDEVEHDMDRIRAQDPHVWDNTSECPDCGTRHTVAVRRHSRLHDEADAGTSCLIEEPCDDCTDQVMEELDGGRA